jgi:hypothetical protein
MIDEEYIEIPKKDKPKPEPKDSSLAKWLERHCGFRPIDVEW